MEPFYIIIIGLMVSCSVYMLLSRHLIKFLFGVILLSNAVNLAIFIAGRLGSDNPAFVPDGQQAPILPVANALPQALILTAIVIGFGLLAFFLALVFRTHRDFSTLDMEKLRDAEPLPEPREHS